ncbi:MAG TPA: hypothetical protein VF365_06955 [Candidatus Limnocylindria bacterium]
MTRSEQRVVDERRNPPVHGPPLAAEILVQDRRQQRVCEANNPILVLDDMRDGRRLKGARRNACSLQESI